ncbi:MAG: ABC transporter ATP-binding protein [Acidimicrobiales bacterium]|nr:ABC transporter ATP-binding protein [Acidimicrobiales bacterium]MYD84181.1 ABC transporter ATP-binding protein [Acidimicrobiales bacterium]MYJ64153.1 ABC transporter ATP-binding protein [Acidimicrobiales bacterium]MYJ64370.1 ABC transporter ATP-binding protein [Acidimicrobiales bacterium]
MSPLLFLAIAIVVPLLGMIVLGIGARIKHQKATDDETGLFRRKLESIAPPVADDPSPGTPGLVRAMRRRRGAQTAKQAPGQAAAQSAPRNPARKPPAPAPASVRLVERDYTMPQLPPLSTDLEELPPPAGDRRSRRAVPRPPEADRRHDRVISASQRPNQGRHPGS